MLTEGFFIRPAPLFFELLVQEADAPAGFFADLLEDLKDFFLFAPDHKTFGGDGEGAEGDAGYAPVFDMGYYATDLMGLEGLHAVHFRVFD